MRRLVFHERHTWGLFRCGARLGPIFTWHLRVAWNCTNKVESLMMADTAAGNLASLNFWLEGKIGRGR